MKLVVIFGPPAVGKMTVGRELAKITNLKLFHNHMSLELVNQFFDFGTRELDNLDKTIRFAIFEAVAKSDLEGLIFTIVWDFDFEEDEIYMNEIFEIFEQKGADILLVELRATQEERLQRNKHPYRLQHKPSKRDIDWSEKALLNFDKLYRMYTVPEDIPGRSHLLIDNTNIPPDKVAEQIKEHFKL